MKRKVLIIEDNNQDRLLLRSLVEMENCEPVIAVDGLYGSQKYLELREELVCVFLDFSMPEMNGLEFLMCFQGLAVPKSYVPIHLVTANERVSLSDGLMNLGIQSIIRKPVSSEGNVRSIKKIITESRGLTWR